CQHYYRAPFTF
nr:immunoglobulin light chain junction region [Macaca mulatta]MOW11825.1 immunoglobulin light chain junction region [Macaca mulatta]